MVVWSWGTAVCASDAYSSRFHVERSERSARARLNLSASSS